MSNLFTQENARVLVVGTGSMGCMAARLGAENDDGNGGVAWSAAHSGATELIATGLDRKIFLRVAEGPFAAESAVRSVVDNGDALARMARSRDAVVLCGCLTEPLTPPILQTMSTQLTRMKIPVFVLALEPISALELKGLEQIEATVQELATNVPFLALLSPGVEKISAGISTKRVQRMAAEKLMGAAECFAANLDSNQGSAPQLRRMRGRHRATFATVSGSPAGAATGAGHASFELALSCLEEGSRERLNAVLLQSAEDLPFRDARAIMKEIPDSARNRAAVCSATRPAYAGQTACLLLSAEKNATNVTSIAEAFGVVARV